MTRDCSGHEQVCFYPARDYYEIMCIECHEIFVYSFCTKHGAVMHADFMYTLKCNHQGGGKLVWSGLIDVEV